MMSASKRPNRATVFGIPLPVFTKGSFAWNLTFTSSRSLVRILAQFIFTPIIVRFYDPLAYGSFGFINSLSVILISLFTLQYDKALFLAHDEKEVKGLRTVINALPVYLSVIVFILLWAARDEFLNLSNTEYIGNGIFWVPVLVVLGAWSQTSQRMVGVRYRYKEGFLYGSVMIIGSKLVAIGYGVLIGGHFFGLALADAMNKIVQYVVNIRSILKERPLISRDLFVLTTRQLGVMRKYIGFPKYELPAVGVAAISNQIPLFWIPAYFSLSQFGQYSLAVALLEMPMRLFGYSLSGVFYQKAAHMYSVKGIGALASITYRMMVSIALIGCIPLLGIWLFAGTIFSWFFGAQWVLAGDLASTLSLYYFTRLAVEPITSVLRVIGEQRNYFWVHGVFFIMRAIAVAFAITSGLELEESIFTYSLANAVGYILLGIHIIFRLERRKRIIEIG